MTYPILRRKFLITAVATLATASSSFATNLNWDPSGSHSSGGGGAGSWATGGTTTLWYNGTTDQGWTDTTGTDTAIFGGSAGGTVTLAGNETANALNFITGGYTLTGGTLTLAGSSPDIEVSSGNTATLASVITGTAGLTLGANGGIGTLTLTATNTYTGGTTVDAGNLTLGAGGSTGVIRGALTINSGATVTANTGWSLGYGATTSVSGITINNGTLNFTGTAGSGGTAASTITMTGGAISGLAFDWYNGITNTPTLVTNAGTTEAIVSSGFNLRLGASTNNLTLNVAAGTVSNGVDLLVSGVISSDNGGGITKTGAGTAVLSGNNTYNGGTTINAGTLRAGSSTAFSTGTVTLNSGGTLDVGGQSLANAITLGGGSVAGTGTLSGVISGSGALNISSNLTLSGNSTYTGATTVSAGTLNVAGGLTSSITVNSGGTLTGAGSTTGNLTLSAGSTLIGAAGTAANTNGTAFTVANVDTSAGGIVVSGTASAGGLIDIVRYTGSWTGNSGNFDLSAYRAPSVVAPVLGATGNKLQFSTTVLTDTWTAATGTWDNSHGAGVWSNTGSGADNLFYSGDAVQFNDIGGQTAATVTLGASVTPGSVTFNNNATNYTLNGTGGITGATSLVKGGTGTVSLNGANTYTGGTTITAGTLQLGGSGSLGSGSYVGTLALSSGATFNDASSANQTLSGVISGAGALTQSGTGTLTLSGANTYTGATTVTGGTLNITGSIAGASAITLAGGTLASSVTTAFSNAITVASGQTGTIKILGAAQITLSGNLTGVAGTLVLDLSGASSGHIQSTSTTGVALGSTVSLIGSSNGNTIFNLNNTAGAANFLANAKLTLNTPGTGSTIIYLGNTGGVTMNVGALDGGDNTTQITSDNNTSTVTITGVASGNYGGLINNGAGSGQKIILVKNGAGTQTLSNANGYTGTTTVNAGALLINGSLASGSAVTVASGGVLGGTGTVNGTITVNGVLQGGSGAASGSLTTVGAVTLASGSVVQLALGAPGTSSKIAVGAGGMTFQINQKFSFLNIGGAAAPGTYTLITGLAADPGSEGGWTITNAGWTGTFSYAANAISLNLTAVPEPGTYGLIGAGALAAAVFVSRRRKLAGVAA